MSDNQRSTSIAIFSVLTLIWGTSFILIKQGLKVFSPDEVGAIRVSAAALFLLPIAIVQLKDIKKEHYWKLFLSGLMGIFIPAFLFAFAQTRMESSVAGIINTLTPIFTVLISAIIFKQRFKGYAILGILIGFGGAALLIISRSGGSIGGINLFALLIVLACIFYASNLNFVKFSITDLRALTITSVSLLLIGPLAITYLFGFTEFIQKFSTHEGAWRAFGFIVLLGLMSTAIATLLFNRLVKISSPLFVSSVTYLMPIVAVIWGVLDGEQLGVGHFIGMVAIFGGVYLAYKK